ncbi:MAG: Mini-ribonuclease 3 [Erysipelotrichaceae bacterium]|nr:Mini-ribonuclease 3 [Erysipelotrichaceae bacterium]
MNVNDYSPLALAFIGDAHYNMIVKRHVIDHEVKMDRMQKLATKYVSAKAQARIMEHLLQLDILTEEEIDYYKRGRNTKAHKAPRNTDPVTYHVSTGFEALWGYWYLNGDEARMKQIWDLIETMEES